MFVSLVFGSSAQEANAPAPPAADPICGFIAGPHFYHETDRVKQGLSVDIFVGQPRANQPVTLRFFVHQKPRNVPVDQLQIEHERFIHVIGVRQDLKEFFHLHPVKVSPGMWEVSHTFAEAGNYKIWTDVKSRGISYSFGHPLLSVVANGANDTKTSTSEERAAKSPYQVTFKHSEPLAAGRTNQLQFLIRDPSGNTVETENYLGAPMHLVIVKDDLSVYLHAHPESRGSADSPIRFTQSFEQEGHYKLFAQFRPTNAKLPEGETVLEEFNVTVGGSVSASNSAAR